MHMKKGNIGTAPCKRCGGTLWETCGTCGGSGEL